MNASIILMKLYKELDHSYDINTEEVFEKDMAKLLFK